MPRRPPSTPPSPPQANLQDSAKDIHALVRQGGQHAKYVSRRRQTLHFKIPGFTPADLPPGDSLLQLLNQQLGSATAGQCIVVGMAARAGCIELVLDLLPLAADPAGMPGAAEAQVRLAWTLPLPLPCPLLLRRICRLQLHSPAAGGPHAWPPTPGNGC